MERNDIGLIYYAINKMKLGYRQDEIIDIAYIGYAKALNTYNEDKGSLSTYAYACIRNEIKRYFQSKDTNKRKYDDCCLSLNDLMKKEGNEFVVFIEDEYVFEKTVENRMLFEKIVEVAKVILTKRQYQVFDLYFLKGYKTTEIGQILGVSSHDVSATKRTAIRKLKNNKEIKEMEVK